jgi:hypothetical protein
MQKRRIGTSSAFAALLLAAAPVRAVEFSIFADVDYASSSARTAREGFSLGQFDVFASQQIGEKSFAVVEFSIETEHDGFEVDLERVLVQHGFGDALSVSAGRFHTPIGYWNTAWHHGALMYDTTGRPAFLDYEHGADAILPVHMVGVLFSGNLAHRGWPLSYDVGIGNGDSIDTDAGAEEARTLAVNNTGDTDDTRAVMARVGWAPENRGFGLGLFAGFHHIAEAGAGATYGVERGGTLVSQTLHGVDLNVEHGGFDMLAELFRLSSDSEVEPRERHVATAFYAQFGYRCTRAWKTVYRLERVAFDEDDAYFSILSRREHTRHVLAARYDVDDSNALKFELQRRVPEAGEDAASTVIVQWAFVLP